MVVLDVANLASNKVPIIANQANIIFNNISVLKKDINILVFCFDCSSSLAHVTANVNLDKNTTLKMYNKVIIFNFFIIKRYTLKYINKY